MVRYTGTICKPVLCGTKWTVSEEPANKTMFVATRRDRSGQTGLRIRKTTIELFAYDYEMEPAQ